MLKFFAKRLTYSIALVFAVMLFVFSISRFIGDPRDYYLAKVWSHSHFNGRDLLIEEMAWDKPLVVRFFVWGKAAVSGETWFWRSDAVAVHSIDLIVDATPTTALLVAGGFAFSFAFGIPFGVLSALSRGSILDGVITAFARAGRSLPVFWLGIVLLLLFAHVLEWLPALDAVQIWSRAEEIQWHYLVLPTVSMGTVFAANLMQITRSAMFEVIESERIAFLKAKGIIDNRTVWRLAVRNALVTSLAHSRFLPAGLITGAIVLESTLGLGGVGSLALYAVLGDDFPLLTGIMLLVTATYAVLSLVVDFFYALADPRIRQG